MAEPGDRLLRSVVQLGRVDRGHGGCVGCCLVRGVRLAELDLAEWVAAIGVEGGSGVEGFFDSVACLESCLGVAAV